MFNNQKKFKLFFYPSEHHKKNNSTEIATQVLFALSKEHAISKFKSAFPSFILIEEKTIELVEDENQ